MTDWDRDRENNQPALDLMDVVENPETGGWAIDSLTCLQVSRLWKLFLKACEFETFPVRCSLVVKIVCCEVLYLAVSELEFEKSCEK